jgi:hypothetical protein
LRGIAQISTVTIAAELGNTSSKDRMRNRRLPLLIHRSIHKGTSGVLARSSGTLNDVTAFLASKSINMTSSTLQTTLYQAAYAPYTLFLVAIWPMGPAAASSSSPS